MKINKLLLGLFFMGALVLSGCGNNSSKNSSSNGSSEQSSSSDSTSSDSSSEHVHEYVFDSFIWTETPGAYTAKAHYVCSADDAYVNYDASVSKDDERSYAPSCNTSGYTMWVASYDSHEEDREEVLPATDEHTCNANGFCIYCHTYCGSEISLASTVNIGNMSKNDIKHYRLKAVNSHLYRVGDISGIEAEDVTVFTLQDGNCVAYIDNTAFPSNTDDNYLYINVYAHEDRSDALLSIYGNHNYNSVGVCLADNDFNGRDLTVGVALENLTLTKGTTYSFRVELLEGHKYRVTHTNISASERSVYRMEDGGNIVSFGINSTNVDSGKEEWPGASNDTYGKYAYIQVTPTANVTSGTMLVSVYSHPINEYGFCEADDTYTGDTYDVGDTINGINLSSGDKLYFRFDIEVGHAYTLEDTTGEMTYKFAKGYIRDFSTGAMSLISSNGKLTDEENYLSAVGEGYCYVVVEATATVSSGELTIKEHHNFNAYGLCPDCEAYNGEDLTIGVSSSSFSLAVSEVAYFRYEASQDSPAPYVEYNQNINGNILQAFYQDDSGVFHEFSINDSNLGYVEFHFVSDVKEGDYIYFVCNNVTSGAISNLTLEVVSD